MWLWNPLILLLIGIRLKEADSEASRCRDINFYRKKTQMFQIFGDLDLYLLSIYNILYSPFSESLLWAGGMARGGGWWEVGTEGESQAFSLLFCSLTFLFSFVCQVIHWGFNLFLSLNSFVTEVSCSGFHFSLHLPTCANAIRSDLPWGKKL